MQTQNMVYPAHILEYLPCGVVLIDGEGVVEWLNASALALLKKDWRQELWRDVIAVCFAPRADDGHEVSLRDGRLVKVAIAAIPDCPGQIISLTDVTQSRAYEQANAQRSRLAALGQMTAQLAHQLRNILASATLFSNQLADELAGAGGSPHYLQRIEDCHASIGRHIDDLLRFSRGENMRCEPMPTEHIVEQLRQLLNGLQAQWSGTCAFAAELSQTVVPVNCDALLGAVYNVLQNAVQAKARTIMLRLSEPDAGSWQIEVQDDGHGVAPEVLAKLGTPFMTTKARGTGLGLAVVESVARAHGGQLSIRSIDGQGTVVCLTLAAKVEHIT
ncbi:MAG: ATP-binding protein [Legionellaceae bacterium]|nr:ATP-binding protein [Legionellaceae bacterium]